MLKITIYANKANRNVLSRSFSSEIGDYGVVKPMVISAGRKSKVTY